MDLDELLQAARDREPGAMASLMRLLMPELRAYFSGCFPAIEANDLAQQTAMVVLADLPGFQPRRSLRGWVFGVARNKALQYVRKRGRDLALMLEGAKDPNEWGPGLSTYVRSKDYQAKLLERIAQLPPELREVIENDLSDGDLDQLAERLNLERGTLRTRRFRALELLRALFTPRC